MTSEYKPVSSGVDEHGDPAIGSRHASLDEMSAAGSLIRESLEAGGDRPPAYYRSSSHHQLREATDDEKSLAKRKRYIYAGIALVFALASFVIQTETAGYMANGLGYKKPIFCLYLTHSSWMLMWPLQLLFLRVLKRQKSFKSFLSKNLESTYQTATIVVSSQSKDPLQSPIRYILKVCGFLVLALNVAGCSWYVAVNFTTPDDLTAIYNCQAFFAYAFSVPILREPFRYDKAFAVLLSIVGVVVVAYSGSTNRSSSNEYPLRALGNLVIGVGAVLYGLYEVLYKRLASPPNSVSAKRQAAFANVIGSILGAYTFCFLWIAIPILHYTGVERFELPDSKTGLILGISVLSNMTFSGSFLILMTLTSPVLSSVASLLTTFLVPIVDFLIFGTEISKGDLLGGVIIILAFVLLSYASYQELQEEGTDDESDSEEAAYTLHRA